MQNPETFCRIMDAWAEACMTPLPTDNDETASWRKDFSQHWRFIRFAILKSCLLDRLFYGGDVIRSRPCPVHRGVWSGITIPPCEHCGRGPCSCNTGWLPEPNRAPNH